MFSYFLKTEIPTMFLVLVYRIIWNHGKEKLESFMKELNNFSDHWKCMFEASERKHQLFKCQG